jgi:hypothetical protein
MKKVILIYQDTKTGTLTEKTLLLSGNFQTQLQDLFFELLQAGLTSFENVILSTIPFFIWENLKTHTKSTSFKTLYAAICEFFRMQQNYILTFVSVENQEY